MDEGKAMEQAEGIAGATAGAAPPDGADGLKARVIEAISQVYDPEIPVNIYELGLIYRLDVARDGNVEVDMTLTSPACPVAGSLPGEVESRIREVEGVSDVRIELVWEPAWTPDKMTEAARLELGMM
jgi:FeS assembly SUF system protein